MLKLPLIGISAFVILYIYSSTLYPGGSQSDANSVGFDWIHNYWCNLLMVRCPNGQINPARPYSIVATIILSISLMFFFVQFATAYARNEIWQKIISICGILSMALAILIFTPYHDVIIVASSLLGVAVVIGMIRIIYIGNDKVDKSIGVICLFLILLNNLIYWSGKYIVLLPLLQKITFAIILIWFSSFSIRMLRKND